MKFKIILTLVVIAGFMIYFTMCSDNDSGHTYYGIHMTQQASIDKNLEKIQKNIDGEDIITKIVFNPKKNHGVTKYSDKVELSLYRKDSEEMIKYIVYLGSKAEQPEEKEADKFDKRINKEEGIAFKDIDFSNIAGYINEAGEKVKNMSTENNPLFFSGVGKYTMTLNNDPKKMKHEFTIESKDTTKSSRSMDIYYEFKFRVDGEGNMNGPLKK